MTQCACTPSSPKASRWCSSARPERSPFDNHRDLSRAATRAAVAAAAGSALPNRRQVLGDRAPDLIGGLATHHEQGRAARLGRHKPARAAHLDRRCVLVAREHPEAKVRSAQQRDRLGDALLQPVLDRRRAEQGEVALNRVVHLEGDGGGRRRGARPRVSQCKGSCREQRPWWEKGGGRGQRRSRAARACSSCSSRLRTAALATSKRWTHAWYSDSSRSRTPTSKARSPSSANVSRQLLTAGQVLAGAHSRGVEEVAALGRRDRRRLLSMPRAQPRCHAEPNRVHRRRQRPEIPVPHRRHPTRRRYVPPPLSST